MKNINMVKVVIEICKGGHYKNIVKNGVVVPGEKMKKPIVFDYGYIPYTWQGDNMELDAYYICHRKLWPCAVVEGEPIAIIHVDDNGSVDDKVVVCEPNYKGNKHKAIQQVVKACRNKPGAVIKGIDDAGVAMREILRCMSLYSVLSKK